MRICIDMLGKEKGSVGLFILFIFLDANVHTKTRKKQTPDVYKPHNSCND